MTDSVFVLPPGERVTDDSTGEPVSGGTLYFYDAGTTTPKTVYADSDLLVALGTSVVTDALGYPTSDGVTRTLIYVGTARYKIVIKDASGVPIATHDNIPGAVVSASSVDVAVTAIFPVISKSANYTVLAADQNTTFVGICSAGTITFTLPSAVTVGTGWKIKIQHAGTANRVLVAIASGSGQTISEGSKSFSDQFVLNLNGEDAEFTSDGGNWRVSSHTPPFIKKSQGIIPVVSRLGTSPGSPAAGDLYLLTGTGGAWSAFATGDIALYTGTAWLNFTPYSNCGWRAWVQGESLYYSYISSAWAVETATSTQPGTFKASTQSAQESASANDTAVTPGTQQWHPSAAKVWGKADVSGGTPSISGSYNMTSITDSGTGQLTVTIATDFSSGAWASQLSIADSGTTSATRATSHAAGSILYICENSISGAQRDPNAWDWTGHGDQ